MTQDASSDSSDGRCGESDSQRWRSSWPVMGAAVCVSDGCGRDVGGC